MGRALRRGKRVEASDIHDTFRQGECGRCESGGKEGRLMADGGGREMDGGECGIWRGVRNRATGMHKDEDDRS